MDAAEAQCIDLSDENGFFSWLLNFLFGWLGKDESQPEPAYSGSVSYTHLMRHRIKKQDDYNHDKWIGVCGKFERFESPEDCRLREVKEETGRTLKRFRARGLLTFIWGNMTEFIHLYTCLLYTSRCV